MTIVRSDGMIKILLHCNEKCHINDIPMGLSWRISVSAL